MKKLSVITTLIGAMALTLPLSLLAEHHEEGAAAPSLSEVWIVMPKTGMEAEFEAALAADKAMRAKGKDARSWQVFNVVAGGNFGAVAFRACCFNWADQDAYEEQEEAKGFAAHWNENVHPYVARYQRHFETVDMENSHWPEGKTNGPYYGVTTWTLKEGAGPASEAAREKMSKLALEEGWAKDDNNWLWLSRDTGKAKTMLVASYENYAAMQPPEQSFFEFANEKIGEEDAAAMFSDFGSGFSSSEYTIWVRNDELSAEVEDE